MKYTHKISQCILQIHLKKLGKIYVKKKKTAKVKQQHQEHNSIWFLNLICKNVQSGQNWTVKGENCNSEMSKEKQLHPQMCQKQKQNCQNWSRIFSARKSQLYQGTKVTPHMGKVHFLSKKIFVDFCIRNSIFWSYFLEQMSERGERGGSFSIQTIWFAY